MSQQDLRLTPEQIKQLKGEPPRRSLKQFIRAFWHVIQPQAKLVEGYFLDAIVEHLEHIKDVRNLLICLPPRMGKSTLCCLWFAWYWITHPEARFLFASYSLQLSTRDSLYSRRVIESDLYKSYYGHLFTLTTDQNTKTRFENDKTGCRLATAIEGSGTGEGGDFVVVDDPHNIQQIESKAERDQVIRWYREAFANRLNNPATGCRLIIGQRCHAEDLFANILKNDTENDWCKCILPCEYRPNKVTVSKLGWQDPRTQEGELLSPDRLPAAEVKFLKATLGRKAFNAQYNQEPAPKEDALFDTDNLNTYTTYDPTACIRLASVDLALSADGDYTVIIVADVSPDGAIYLLHLHRERMPSPKIIPTLVAVYERYKPLLIYIEDVGFQKVIITEARLSRLPAKGVQPHNASKEARSVILQCKVEGHQLYMPVDAPWTSALLDELGEFPNGSHDDIVDALSYLVNEANRLVRHMPQQQQEEEKTEDELKEEESKRYLGRLLEGLR